MQLTYFLERLPKISSLSVFVEPLSTNHNEELISSLQLTLVDSDMLKLNLNNNSHTTYIPVPFTIKYEYQNNTQISDCYKLHQDKIVIRLPLQNTSNDRSINSLMLNNSKWSAKYLVKPDKFNLCCFNCDTRLLVSSNISKISEMPSELWSEMMDFWHCHKPHNHTSTQEQTHGNDKFNLSPLSSELITGSYYFAFNNVDNELENVQSSDNSVFCSNCSTQIGEIDKANSNLLKIFKWSVRLNSDSAIEVFQPHYFIYSSLLDNINSNATRIIEFINDSNTDHLLVWVFNTGIDYVIHGDKKLIKNAMKVYYTTDLQDVEQERIDRGDLESIIVPDLVLKDSIETLDRLNEKLPNSLRTFGASWKMGLLNME